MSVLDGYFYVVSVNDPKYYLAVDRDFLKLRDFGETDKNDPNFHWLFLKGYTEGNVQWGLVMNSGFGTVATPDESHPDPSASVILRPIFQSGGRSIQWVKLNSVPTKNIDPCFTIQNQATSLFLTKRDDNFIYEAGSGDVADATLQQFYLKPIAS